MRDVLREQARNLRLGKHIECLRWAERTVGVIVRKGQHGPDKWIADKHDGIHSREDGLVSALQFFKNQDDRTTAYLFADSNEAEFADAIEMAKANRSLSRSEVALNLSNIRDRPPPRYVRKEGADRPELLRKRRRIKVEQVIEQSIATIEGVFVGLNALDDNDFKSISREESQRWFGDIGNLVGELRKFRGKVGYASRTAPGAQGVGQVGSD